jgi:hypothetical protein
VLQAVHMLWPVSLMYQPPADMHYSTGAATGSSYRHLPVLVLATCLAQYLAGSSRYVYRAACQLSS